MTTASRRANWIVFASSATAMGVITVASVATGLFAIGGHGRSAASPSEESAALQSHADDVFERFNGTVAQRRVSGMLQAWALNGEMDACMAGAGFPEWDWSTGHRAAPRTNALDTSVWFASPLNPSYSNALRDSAEYLIQEQALRIEVPSEKETSAVVKCVNDTPATSDEEADRASTPEVVSQLRNQWWTMLESLDAKYGNPTAYESCFNAAAKGVPVEGVSADSWQRVLAQSAPQPEDVPQPSVDEKNFSASWSHFLDLEKTLVAADWSCRSDVYESHYQDVSLAIDEFAAEHAASIEEAGRAWESLVKGAGELRSP